jgi:hypothetical protein
MSIQAPVPPNRLRTMQIVAGAIIFGALSFLGIVLFVVQNNEGKGRAEPPEGTLPLISLIALGMTLAEVPIAFILPAAVLRQTLANLANHAPDSYVVPASPAGPGGPTTDTAFLLATKQTIMIITLALFEGASFFGSIAYLLEASPVALVVSAGAIVLLLVQFPTEGQVTTWLEQQRIRLNSLRARPREQR